MVQLGQIDQSPDEARTAKRQSATVALIVALCATLVVAMVFSMADRTRAVATDANIVHGIDLASSHVDRITHGIGAAALLSTSDTNKTADRLADVARDLAVAEAIVGSSTAPDIVELADFVDATQQALDGISANPAPTDIDARLDLVADQSELVTGRYAEMAEERLESIQRAERLLARFGALGGGAVAFVIPVLAIYLHLRLRDGEQRAHNATIAYHWRLTATEQRLRRILERLAAGLDLLGIDVPAGQRQLRATLIEGQVDQGQLVLKPEPVDLGQMAADEPELPGLPRRTSGLSEIRCLVDPTTFRAALVTIESTMLDSGADGVDITLHHTDGHKSAELRISSDGTQAAPVGDPRLAGAIPVIRTLLSSGGLDHTINESGSTWTLVLPVDSPHGEQSGDPQYASDDDIAGTNAVQSGSYQA